MSDNAGTRLRAAMALESPLQLAGAINAYCAKLAERAGFRALYLSGAGVANASFGLPDLALTTLNDVCEDARRITAASELPIVVDADTGWGDALMIARTVRSLAAAGVAGLHIEDQFQAKRCGHRPGKMIVATAEMVDRIKAAVDARTDDIAIIARTDAFANEGLQASIDRAAAYVEAGADMVFPDALTELDQYRAFVDGVDAPVVANLTEFGKTPLLDLDELRGVGVRLAIYPVSAFRAMTAAATAVYETLRREGTQRSVVHTMDTRDHLYEVLGYHDYERKIDELFGNRDEG